MNAFDHMINPHQGDPCEICSLPSGVTENEECLGALLANVRNIRNGYADILSQLDFFEARAKVMARIYADLKDISGEVLRIEGAKATVTRPKKARVYWDGKGLEAYSKENPEVLEFREEKWSNPSVRIIVD